MEKRKVLTIEEFNAVSKLTEKLKVPFDICHNGKKNIDQFVDYEANEKRYCLTTGFLWLCDAIAYPLKHDGINENEISLIVNLLKEFCNIDKEFENFLKSKEKEEE